MVLIDWAFVHECREYFWKRRVKVVDVRPTHFHKVPHNAKAFVHLYRADLSQPRDILGDDWLV